MLRARTARLLAKRGDTRNTDTLIACLQSDPSETVRAEAATALGEHRSALARAALAKTISGSDTWRVRAAAARAYGVDAEEERVGRFTAWLGNEQQDDR